jgi:hypothetical protein
MKDRLRRNAELSDFTAMIPLIAVVVMELEPR